MVRITMVFGLLWVALGAGEYFLAANERWLAFGCVAMGLAMIVLGFVALRGSLRKSAMHIAVGLALAGFLLTVHALLEVIQRVLKEPSLVVKSLIATLCAAFIALAVKSFISARRNRPAAVPAEAKPSATTDEVAP